MPRYTAESKERVREAVDMIELVGARTDGLRRSGADSYIGRCPFHDERTPSFSVKPSSKVYYCFGCQAAGDAFNFVMETESLDFAGALEFLADRCGITLEVEEEDPRAAERRRRRDRLLELLERTCSYYERTLWESPEGEGARRYLAERGLEEGLLREFRVGFAPSAWDRVLSASRRGGFSEAELLACGLVLRSVDRPGSVYDYFRRRITFPLCDQRGRVLGFGGRIMGAEDPRKYVNSPDGEIYHKGRHLFATHLARPHAAKAGSVVLCEGYTDVIAAHQAGVRNCVGLMGTALTDEQVGELARLAPRVVLALDADGAGQAAMMKAASVAAGQRFELRVAALPVGSDPADVLRTDGARAVKAMIDGSLPFVRFRVERILASGDAASPEGRDRILDELRPVFEELPAGAMREELEREVVSRLGVSEKLIEQLFAGRRGGAATAPGRSAVAAPLAGPERTERAFLELCVALPERGLELLEALDLDALFAGRITRAAAAHLREHIQNPSAAVNDSDLAVVLAELEVRAAALTPVPAELEAERCQLELTRVARAIARGRGAGGGGLLELQREREGLSRELDGWLSEALEQTAAPRA
ncbi:MAG TPA: DNA primase [Solirubrobacteraceae bacterium]|jgi:DNA primase|nr:DNA primase [Solirubrobacteraceae bacterium]